MYFAPNSNTCCNDSLLTLNFTLNDTAGLRLVAFQPVDSFLFFFWYQLSLLLSHFHPKMVDFLSSNFGFLITSFLITYQCH